MKLNIRIIKDFLYINHLTRTEFCKKCQIGYQTLNKILTNKTNFKLVVLLKIAKYMKVDLYKFFK